MTTFWQQASGLGMLCAEGSFQPVSEHVCMQQSSELLSNHKGTSGSTCAAVAVIVPGVFVPQ